MKKFKLSNGYNNSMPTSDAVTPLLNFLKTIKMDLLSKLKQVKRNGSFLEYSNEETHVSVHYVKGEFLLVLNSIGYYSTKQISRFEKRLKDMIRLGNLEPYSIY